MERDRLIEEELEITKQRYQKLSGVTQISCLPVLVQYKIHKTIHKELTVCMQFPQNYPNEVILIELKSKVFGYKFITGLQGVVEKEAKKYLGERQVMIVLRFLHTFLDENPLCVCSEEISRVKQKLLAGTDKMILKQKNSQIVLKLKEESYYLNARLTVPDLYPDDMLQVEIKDNNFCSSFFINIDTQAKEIARRCVQPPLRKNPKAPPFKPTPSLYSVVEYLSANIMRKYPHEKCPVCTESALVKDPKDVRTDPSHPKFVYRVYCSHLYHFGCLETYMSTPPFTGGKKCPACNVRIFHEKWKLPPAIAEARWAHKEARARELDEVVDFLNS